MSKVRVLAIMGKSSSGKSALQKAICKMFDVHKVVTTTTRPIRQGEEQGVDYNFTTVEEFTEKVLSLEMLEATDFNDWFYGTELGALHGNKINIAVLNPAGVLAMAEDGRIDLKVVYLDTDDKVRLMRSLNREAKPNCKEICRRFFADEKDFNEEVMDELADMNLDVVAIQNDGNFSLQQIATKLAPFIFGPS